MRVASAAERVLLKLGGRAPDCGLGRASGSGCPALGGQFEHWRIMLARLIGGQCATACGPWRCACGPPVSAGPGSGVRPVGSLIGRGHGLPPRRCACTASCALVCASALAVAAAATSTVRRIQGSSHLATAAAGNGGGPRAAAAVFSDFFGTSGYAGYCKCRLSSILQFQQVHATHPCGRFGCLEMARDREGTALPLIHSPWCASPCLQLSIRNVRPHR